MRTHPLVLALLVFALTGGSCTKTRVYVLGDSHSDADRTPRHDWLPHAPADWKLSDLATSGGKCWEIVPYALTEPLLNRGDVMVIFCGTNDTSLDDWDLEVTAGWIEFALDDATSKGRTAVAVVPPPAFRDYPIAAFEWNQRLDTLRTEIYALADQYGARVADVWDETWAHPDPESLFTDGLHFGAAGQAMMAQVIQDAVENAP